MTTSETYGYPAGSNRLAAITRAGSTVRSFSYDPAGNTTGDTRGGTAYTYTINDAGRISQASVGGAVRANYTYDGKNRLSIRQLAGGTPSGTTHLIHDKDDRLIAETDGAGVTLRDYVWVGDTPVAVLDGTADPANPTLLWVYADHLKRPEIMTDAAGQVVWKAVYEPFGAVHSVTGPAANDQRFPGQWFQLETGLHYNWHRHYDPSLGRYTQPDPLSVNLPGIGPSLYAYAGNSPVMNVDPDGRQFGATRPRPFPPMTPFPDLVPSRLPKPFWWKLIEGATELCRRAVSGGGGGGSNDFCYERESEERARCFKHAWAVAHPDYKQACLDRAAIRRDMCLRNAGRPHPEEPPEWKPGPNLDEETWRNYRR